MVPSSSLFSLKDYYPNCKVFMKVIFSCVSTNGFGSAVAASFLIGCLLRNKTFDITILASKKSTFSRRLAFIEPSSVKFYPSWFRSYLFQSLFRIFYCPPSDSTVFVCDDFPFLRASKQILFLQQAL